MRGLSSSVKEGAISKRSNDDFRGRSIFIRAPFLCDKCKFHHGQKWFVLKDSFLVYINPNSATVGFPMLYDQSLTIEDGFRKTGTSNAIRIKNLQRLMIIKFDKEDDRDLWLEYFSQVKLNCSLTVPNPFNSFAPKRQQQYAQWLVNKRHWWAVFYSSSSLPCPDLNVSLILGLSMVNRTWQQWQKVFSRRKKRSLSPIGGFHRRSCLFVRATMVRWDLMSYSANVRWVLSTGKFLWTCMRIHLGRRRTCLRDGLQRYCSSRWIE